MNDELKAEIIKAVTQMAEDNGGKLNDEPHVKDIESMMGKNIDAADRNAVWKELKADLYEPAPDEEKPKAGVKPKAEKAKGKDKPKAKPAKDVTNNSKSRLEIKGVAISPGATESVPGFDDKHAVMKKWLAANVISAA